MPELPARLAHALSLEKACHKTKTFLHHRALSPGHQHLPPKSEKYYPCVQYDLSPISQVGEREELGTNPLRLVVAKCCLSCERDASVTINCGSQPLVTREQLGI